MKISAKRKSLVTALILTLALAGCTTLESAYDSTVKTTQSIYDSTVETVSGWMKSDEKK